MRFEQAYSGWQGGRLRQEEAARLLRVCERTARRHVDRYEEEGLEGLIDKPLERVSGQRAPVDEVMALVERYRGRHLGWNRTSSTSTAGSAGMGARAATPG